MMDVCGDALGKVATVLMNYEVQVERDILDPLNQLTEVKTEITSPSLSCGETFVALGCR